jgi:hypothetical protein
MVGFISNANIGDITIIIQIAISIASMRPRHIWHSISSRSTHVAQWVKWRQGRMMRDRGSSMQMMHMLSSSSKAGAIVDSASSTGTGDAAVDEASWATVVVGAIRALAL